MSQLSFADFFNMARESADNPPVIQVRAQVAEVVPSVQRMMSEQHSRSRFIRVFKDTGRHLGRWEVFSDFLSLAASELSLPCRVSILTQIQHRACCILIRMRRFHRGDKYPPLQGLNVNPINTGLTFRVVRILTPARYRPTSSFAEGCF